MEKSLGGNYTRILCAVLNKSWKQHPIKQQLYGHLPPISLDIWELHKDAACCFEQILEATPNKTTAVRPLTSLLSKTIKVRRKRHAGHYWRSKDILLWTPTHGRSSVGRPTRTYLYQFCGDTGCSLEDLFAG